jgi:hypothetical protein
MNDPYIIKNVLKYVNINEKLSYLATSRDLSQLIYENIGSYGFSYNKLENFPNLSKYVTNLDIQIDDNIVKTSHDIQEIIAELKFRPVSIYVKNSININNIYGLNIGDSYNQQICGTFPNLRTLILGTAYDYPLDTIIAPNLDKLKAVGYNQPILNIPFKSLKELHLGYYNHPIPKGSIPKNIKAIYLTMFNQPIDSDIFPEGLHRLQFTCFNHPIINYLPNSIEYLTFGINYNQKIQYLPKNLRYLSLGKSFNQHTGNLRKLKKLTKLSITNPYCSYKNTIPISCKTLTILIGNFFIRSSRIPESIINLRLVSYRSNVIYDLDPGMIPDHITELRLYGINQPIKNLVHKNLKTLILGYNFNKPIDGCLNEGLICLNLGDSFNQSIENNIPSTILDLTFGRKFDYPIDGKIPSTVRVLRLNKMYKHPIPSYIKTVIYSN